MAVLVGCAFSEAVQRELKTAFAPVFGGYVQRCNAKDVWALRPQQVREVASETGHR
jgi:hypothetical protein